MRTTFGGSAGSGHSWSAVKVTRSPDRIAAPTAARSLPGSMRKPRSAPNSSSPTDPAASLAVVIDRFGAQGLRDPAGQRVAAALMSAEHRDREAQRLVDADHPGVFVLAVQQRREQPDGRADGEEADDRVAFVECAGQGRGGGAVVAARVGPGSGQAVDGAPGPRW